MNNNTPYQLLGLLMRKPDLINDCQLINNFDEPFAEKWLNLIFQDIKQLYYSTGKVDHRELMKIGAERKTNLDIYADIMRGSGFDISIHDYVSEIHESLVKRKLQILSHELANCSMDELGSASDYLAIVRRSLDYIEKNSTVTTGVTLPEAVKEVLDRAVKLTQGNQEDYLKTGIMAIDRLIYGLTTKTMSIIGARPSVGKSALGLTIMSNLTASNIACGFISVEMSESECVERIIQMRSGVSIWINLHMKRMK